jgi:hypothetical protein
MELNRRDFLTVPAAAMATSLFAADTAIPWQRRIRRVGQTNMTEHDPVVLDVEQWADYWDSLKVDAVMVSVTGILAFYPTKVPFHRKGKYLGDRDFFGDCAAAATIRRSGAARCKAAYATRCRTARCRPMSRQRGPPGRRAGATCTNRRRKNRCGSMRLWPPAWRRTIT